MKTKPSLFFGRRAVLLYAAGIPLLRVLVLTPLLQIFTPDLNFAGSIPYSILFFLSDLITLSALFALLGIAIHALYTERNPEAMQAFAIQCAAFLFIGVLLQAGVYLFLAFLDENFGGAFSFCNYSLNDLLTGGLERALMQSFFGILLLVAILCLSFFTAVILRNRGRRRKIRTDDAAIANSGDRETPVRPAMIGVTAVFFVCNLINDLFETLSQLVEFDFNVRLSYLPTLITPYIKLLIYTVLCYYAVYFFATRAASAALAQKNGQKNGQKKR